MSHRRILAAVFLINLLLFFGEMLAGILARSLGLVADSLDMLADATVYGLSLLAVAYDTGRRNAIARTSGYLQLFLAVFGLTEAIRRFFGAEQTPGFGMMIAVSLVALAGNVVSLFLLLKTKSNEVHIQASLIFTNNDILANIGVIAAGVLVAATGSAIPDLVAAILIFLLVCRGALKILKLARRK